MAAKNELPENTAKEYKYVGPKGSYKFRHGAHAFTLGQITPQLAATLILEGFEYLKAVKKALPKETDSNAK